MAFLKINGTDVSKYIKTCQWQIDDMSSENSGEDLTGHTHKDIIRRKRHLNLEWLPCPLDYAHTVVAAASDIHKPEFDVEFADILAGAFITRPMYVGTRSSPFEIYDEETGKILVSGISFNLIETEGDQP